MCQRYLPNRTVRETTLVIGQTVNCPFFFITSLSCPVLSWSVFEFYSRCPDCASEECFLYVSDLILCEQSPHLGYPLYNL